jgi:hypothetical protein
VRELHARSSRPAKINQTATHALAGISFVAPIPCFLALGNLRDQKSIPLIAFSNE